MRTQIVLFDGFDPLDVIAPYEVLTAASLVTGAELAVEFASAEGPREVPSGLSMSLRATAFLEPSTVDMIVVPGAAGPFAGDDVPAEVTIPAILARALDTPLAGLLKEAIDQPGLTVATVCGGSLLLAMAGLIGGRPATTHHLGMDALGATGAHPVTARVVDDGDLITGASVTSGLDVGLYLLERELGPQTALAVESVFAYERRGTVWRPQAT